ncbi:MAG: cyclophilin-like fold protein [Propionicimonas sp.]
MTKPRSYLRRGRTTLPLLLAALTITACASPAPSGPTPSEPTPTEVPATPQPNEPTPTGRPTPQQSEPTPAGATHITITIGADSYPGTLADNPTARDLATQLPLTLIFKDHNRAEKNAPLPRPLTTTGVPAGADPDVNDIGYYSPSNDLVLYYGDVGYWNGIIRIGTLAEGMGSIARRPDGFTATIALVGPEKAQAKE